MSAPSIANSLMGVPSAELFSEVALPLPFPFLFLFLFSTYSTPTSSNLTPQAGFLASLSLLIPLPVAANSGVDHLR